MFLAKRSNGYFFVEYFDNSRKQFKRVSTGTKNEKEAQRFISNFEIPTEPPKESSGLTLSRFQKEYVEFIGSNHSQKYLSSINLSFNQLKKYTKNCSIEEMDLRTAQQFISETFKRTRYGAYLYNRTLKAAFKFIIL